MVALLEELRRDSPHLHNRVDELAEVITRSADPQSVIDAIKKRRSKFRARHPQGRQFRSLLNSTSAQSERRETASKSVNRVDVLAIYRLTVARLSAQDLTHWRSHPAKLRPTLLSLAVFGRQLGAKPLGDRC